MNSQRLGDYFKKQAKPSGNYVNIEIDNVYETLRALAAFFYRKKHEWVAICFLNANFVCKSIWFNKGSDHTQARLGLTVQDVGNRAEALKCKYVIIAHNHPISSFNMPRHSTRRENIAASYAQKELQFGFSATDRRTGETWRAYLVSRNIGFAQAVIVAGDILLEGNEEIIDNFRSNRLQLHKSDGNSYSMSIAAVLIALLAGVFLFPRLSGYVLPFLVIIVVVFLIIHFATY